jgi:hypothetical protein
MTYIFKEGQNLIVLLRKNASKENIFLGLETRVEDLPHVR